MNHYDLLLRGVEQALTVEEAVSLAARSTSSDVVEVRLIHDFKSLQSLVEDRFSKHAEDNGEAEFVCLRVPENEATEVAELLQDCCDEQRLLMFDPQEKELFWPSDFVPSKTPWLEAADGSIFEAPSASQVDDQLNALTSDTDPYLILARTPLIYLQTLIDPDDGWIMEFQDGGLGQHFVCTSSLSIETVREVFQAYVSGKEPRSSSLEWDLVDLDDADFDHELDGFDAN